MPRFIELQQNIFAVNFNYEWKHRWRKCPQYKILDELIMHENINISHATELSNDDRWQFRWWSLLRRYKQSNHVDWNGMPKCHYWLSVGTRHKNGDCDLHIETGTKWPQFHKWLIRFFSTKMLPFLLNLTEISFQGPINIKLSLLTHHCRLIGTKPLSVTMMISFTEIYIYICVIRPWFY